MYFGFSPEQEALRDLARSICQDHATHDRLKAVERDPGGIDRELWTALAKANLGGVARPARARRWWPAVAPGEAILAAALVELPGEEPAMPATRAVRDGAGWRLDGAKDCGPAAHLASAVLGPARAGGG